MSELFWSFSPWLLFLVANRFTTFAAAVAVGAAAAGVIVARAVIRQRLHLLDIVAGGYFVAMLAFVVVLRPDTSGSWGELAQLGSHLLLTVVVLGSVVVGRPFTASYARATTPPQYWHTSQFASINRRISTAWGAAFLIGTISLLLAASIDARPVLLRVIVPFVALAGAYRFTQTQIADPAQPATHPDQPVT